MSTRKAGAFTAAIVFGLFVAALWTAPKAHISGRLAMTGVLVIVAGLVVIGIFLEDDK